jgi:hypothetical protein
MRRREDLLRHGPQRQVDFFHWKGLVAIVDDFLSTTFPFVKARVELRRIGLRMNEPRRFLIILTISTVIYSVAENVPTNSMEENENEKMADEGLFF